jgi:hypothetical protein
MRDWDNPIAIHVYRRVQHHLLQALRGRCMIHGLHDAQRTRILRVTIIAPDSHRPDARHIHESEANVRTCRARSAQSKDCTLSWFTNFIHEIWWNNKTLCIERQREILGVSHSTPSTPVIRQRTSRPLHFVCDFLSVIDCNTYRFKCRRRCKRGEVSSKLKCWQSKRRTKRSKKGKKHRRKWKKCCRPRK